MPRPSSKKEAILQVATKLFSEHGYWDTSVNDISKATGVAEGTIFYHFQSKEDLFLAVLQKFKEEFIGKFKQYLDENEFSTGLEMVEGAISFYLYQASMMEERFLLLHRHHYYQIAPNNPKCWQHLEEIYSSLISIFEQAIIRGQQDGSIRKVSANKKALLIFTLVDGLVRLDTYNLYKATSLYEELIESCRAWLKP
jgi:TetR/AcrR family fatty acid metabolism transcriptional regulator